MASKQIVINSPVASSMGARISVTGPGRGMYLVTGSAASLDSLVSCAGGEIVLRLNGGKMLTTLPFTGYLALKSDRRVSRIGPVTVDTGRLAAMAKVLAQVMPQKTNGNA